MEQTETKTKRQAWREGQTDEAIRGREAQKDSRKRTDTEM